MVQIYVNFVKGLLTLCIMKLMIYWYQKHSVRVSYCFYDFVKILNFSRELETNTWDFIYLGLIDKLLLSHTEWTISTITAFGIILLLRLHYNLLELESTTWDSICFGLLTLWPSSCQLRSFSAMSTVVTWSLYDYLLGHVIVMRRLILCHFLMT